MPGERTAPNTRFRDYVRPEATDVGAATGALLAAHGADPGADVELDLGRLDALSRAVRRRAAGLRDPYRIVGALNQVCFEDEGLAGAPPPCDAPPDLALHDVLDRRRGAPLALCAVYTEVAARADVPVRAVLLPGAALARLDQADVTLFVDPYRAGRLLGPADLLGLLRIAGGPESEPTREHLRAASPRDLLAQLLLHLHRAYRKTGALAQALGMAECLLYLDARSAEAVKEYAADAARLLCAPDALADLIRRAAPVRPAPDGSPFGDAIRELRRLEARMN
jgi:regulator of sirC expression with transglutaminase-like and TPR domain